MWSSSQIQYSSSYNYNVLKLVSMLIFLCHCRVNSSSTSSLALAPSNNNNPMLSACSALLQFKASLYLDSQPYDSCGHDSSPKIRSWNQSTNCCGWEGVTCDNVSTGHVIIGLDLSCSRISVSPSEANITLLLLPKTIQRLNLAYNNFKSASIPSQLFTHLVSLTHLNLSSCVFDGSVPSEISLLTQLVSLDLSYNMGLRFDDEYSAFDMFARNSSSSKLTTFFLDWVNMPGVPSSSFLNFTSLRRLSLVDCGLQGEFPSEVFRFPRLQYLDLSFNHGITGHLPAESNWSSPIEVLHLSYCDFRGPLPASLGNLTQITSLHLSYNFNFGGEIPNVFGSLRQLGGELRLESSNFSGQLPSTIFNLTQITHLHLSHNRLEGGFPAAHVSGLRSLEELDLSFNLVSGELPSWLFALPSLQNLDISNNKLSGLVPSFSLDLVNLTSLNLSSNNLGGVIALEMLSMPNKLETLDLSHNNLLSLSDSDHDHVNYTIPELSEMRFSYCNISRFPNSLRVANKLTILDLSHNKIQGSISKWGSKGWEELALLDLSNNLLTSYSFDQFPGRKLETLDLRSNQLQGPLLAPPPSIQYFYISKNNLTGEIPSLICNLSWISILDLSRNNLNGIIPPCLGNISPYLLAINLRMNNFYGQIPAFEIFTLRNLVLNDNKLEGPVPRSLVKCTSLDYLNLANNNLNDTFPHWLGVLPKLRYLFLGSNRFHGGIENSMPNSSFPWLRIIDLSQNHFTGLLPTQLFRCLVAHMDFFSNFEKYCFDYGCSDSENYYTSVKVTMKRLKFEIEEGNISDNFTLIDFSLNQFHGSIPEVLGEFDGLYVLNLSHNYLTGPIPPSLGNMQALESLDLSSNMLWGRIPPELTNLNFLEVFNLSQNNLEGPIPLGQQFNTFDNDSYGGNPRLCGSPLSKKCGKVLVSSSTADDDLGIPFIWKVVMMGYGCGVVLGLSIGYIVFTTGRPRWIVRKVEGDWQYNVTKWVRKFGIGGRRSRN